MEENVLLDKAPACLLGLAIGDALGLPVYGMTPYEIAIAFGKLAGFMPSSAGVAGKYGSEATCIGMVSSMIVSDKSIPEPKQICDKIKATVVVPDKVFTVTVNPEVLIIIQI